MAKDSHNLPSIDDFTFDGDNLESIEEIISENNLPSVDDFLKEEEKYPEIEEISLEQENLPSVDDYYIEEEKELLVEEVLEESKEVTLSDLAELIKEVRSNLLDLPEIKHYDKELEKLCEIVDQVRDEIPEVRYYDAEVEAICEQIDEVKDYISGLPEVKYYDEQLETLDNKLKNIKNEISELPEVRYYDEDVKNIKEEIENVRKEIPPFPWIENTFTGIEENFQKVSDSIGTIKENINLEIDAILENINVKQFENKVLIKEINQSLKEEKEKIWEEIKKSSVKIWEYHQEFKDDDRKLKKQIKGEYDSLKNSIEEQLKKYNQESVKTDEFLLKYFGDLREEITNLPEVKYYDEQIKSVESDINSTKFNIKELYSIVRDIKKSQKQIQDEIESLKNLEISEETEEEDPIEKTLKDEPQKFATLDDLSKHYQLFVNRIQQQLATVGGGGAGFIKDLDDVEFDQTTGDGKLLIYDQSRSKWVGIDSTSLGGGGGSQNLDGVLNLGNTSSLGMSVGVVTATSFNGDGSNLTGIVTNIQAGSGITILESPSGNFIITSTGGGSGIATYADVAGIATYAQTSGVSTLSQGLTGSPDITVGFITATSGYFGGNVTIGGTLTYEDVTNVDSIGLITARSGIRVISGGVESTGISTFNTGIGTVHIGIGTTALLVDGDARVVGILTVGRASVTIDGDNSKIFIGGDGGCSVGSTCITIGDNVTINASATGINSAPNVIYVAKDGSDSSNGTSIDNAKLTISGAVAIATTGTIIKVLAGNYAENNPIEVPAFVSIVGDDLKTVTVTPNTAYKDIFHVRKGCYIANMTFTNHVAPAAAIGFPTTEIATNVGGGKWESPYIQNCTSNTTTGTGLRVDGAQAESLKSIVCDSYTQYNQGGVGVAITNQGFAQLVSVFTICCDEAITCYKGSTCDLTNSNSSFGTYGLVSDGVSDEQFTGIVTTTATAAQDNVVIAVTTSVRPYDGQVVYFGQLYESVETITVGSGGTGYTSTPTVTVDSPTGPNGETATAFATLDGDSVSEITIISSGSQYAITPTVTISDPQIGSNTATATANMAPIYYTINSSTPVTAGITTLTLDENLINSVGVGTTAYFFQQSKIVASSHTFEYVGSGNDITTATPLRGGVPIQANEVVSKNGGKVVYTSTDQSGNFRIGDDLQINQNTGTISGRAFSRSLFTEMTPFILALS